MSPAETRTAMQAQGTLYREYPEPVIIKDVPEEWEVVAFEIVESVNQNGVTPAAEFCKKGKK